MLNRCALAMLAYLLVAPAAPLQADSNISVLGRVASSFWQDGLFVHDQLVFMLLSEGGDHVVRIYDVSDPAAPRLLSRTLLPDAGLPDMHGLYYSNGHLFVGVERPGGGFVVFDVRDPSAPVELAYVEIEGGVHNLRLAGDYLYLLTGAGSEADFSVYDVSEPASPVYVSEYDHSGETPSTSYCHDISIMEGIGYSSHWDDGLVLFDVSDPSDIRVLEDGPDRENTHSAWPTADFSSVLTCHELTNEGLRSWDVTTDPHTEMAVYESHETSVDTIVHDVMIVGDYAYVSYYSEGARVLDISDPSSPVEVGSYLTQPGCSGFCSAISQWVENGVFYILDSGTGLWILSFDLPHDAPIQLLGVKSRDGDDAVFSWNHTGESQYTLRRSLVKQTVAGATLIDIDGALSHPDPVVRDGALYFYKVNGPWE